MATYNLVDEPWIPCVRGTPRRVEELGLRETLRQAHELVEIAGDNPLVTVSLHRLLLAVLHRALLGPRDEDAWRALRDANRLPADAIDEYLDRWHERFDLFDETWPFYQTAGLDPAKANSIAVLTFQRSNNRTLFDHIVDAAPPPVPPSTAARLVVAFQSFDTGGIKSGDKGRDPGVPASPLTQKMVCLVRGPSLVETLLLNLHQYAGDDNEEPWRFNTAKDLPAWERNEPTGTETRRPDGYADLLTWQSRRVLLVPEADMKGTVVRYAVVMRGHAFADGVDEPRHELMVPFGKDPKRGWVALRFREDRALWRDSLALVQSLDGERARPRMLDWSGRVAQERPLHLVRTYGLAANRAKEEFWRQEELPLPREYLEDDKFLTEALGKMLRVAEEVGELLDGGPVWRMAELAIAPSSDQPNASRADRERIRDVVESFGAARVYWAALDAPFRDLMVRLPEDRVEHDGQREYGVTWVFREWADTVQAAAWDAFGFAASSLGQSPRGMKAVAVGEQAFGRRLAGILKQLLPEPAADEEAAG